ncbi:MAG: cupin [Candidatus Midichloriaceae bacterium]|nr:cupin [Candidatus Midichloriaceae bacterium]
MTILFDGNLTKNSPAPFAGVNLKSYIHPEAVYNDGFNAKKYGIPDVNYSFGLFTIDPGHEWPATKFSISEVSYCIEGEGIFICDGIEYPIKPGSVIYIPKGEVRIIKNTSTAPLKYLCIVSPAWKPEYEEAL